jgi:hypothetical protein
VILYTCMDGKAFGGLPAPVAHPCGRAAKALDDAGQTYELKQVKGGTLKLWTLPARARDRAEVERLSGVYGGRGTRSPARAARVSAPARHPRR